MAVAQFTTDKIRFIAINSHIIPTSKGLRLAAVGLFIGISPLFCNPPLKQSDYFLDVILGVFMNDKF